MSATTRFRALRGANSVSADDPALVLDATRELLREMVLLNAIEPDQLISVIFTATPDLTSVFPARAARELGWHDVPLLCMTEIAVAGSLPRCVRVLMHVEMSADAGRGQHVYLGAAAELRPDLVSDAVRSLTSSSSPSALAAEGLLTIEGLTPSHPENDR